MHENVTNFASDILSEVLAKYGYKHHQLQVDPPQVNVAMSRRRVYDIFTRENSFEVVDDIAKVYEELTAHIRAKLPHISIEDPFYDQTEEECRWEMNQYKNEQCVAGRLCSIRT